MELTEVTLAEGARLFTTDRVACFDQLIIPTGVTPGMEVYAHASEKDQWYGLQVRGVMSGTIDEIMYEDFTGLTKMYSGRMEFVGPYLVMSQSMTYGGYWTIYTRQEDCPKQLKAYPHQHRQGM